MCVYIHIPMYHGYTYIVSVVYMRVCVCNRVSGLDGIRSEGLRHFRCGRCLLGVYLNAVKPAFLGLLMKVSNICLFGGSLLKVP